MCLFSLKLNFDLDRGVFPMVIQAVVDEGDGRLRELQQSRLNYCFHKKNCSNIKVIFMK